MSPRPWARLLAALERALAQLKPPEIALDSVTIRNGILLAHIAGEPVPRRIQNINFNMRLGRDYRSLALDLQGMPQHLCLASCYRNKQWLCLSIWSKSIVVAARLDILTANDVAAMVQHVLLFVVTSASCGPNVDGLANCIVLVCSSSEVVN